MCVCEALPKCKASRTNEASGHFTAKVPIRPTHAYITRAPPPPPHQLRATSHCWRGIKGGGQRTAQGGQHGVAPVPRLPAQEALVQHEHRAAEEYVRPPVCYYFRYSLLFSPVSDRVLVCCLQREGSTSCTTTSSRASARTCTCCGRSSLSPTACRRRHRRCSGSRGDRNASDGGWLASARRPLNKERPARCRRGSMGGEPVTV